MPLILNDMLFKLFSGNTSFMFVLLGVYLGIKVVSLLKKSTQKEVERESGDTRLGFSENNKSFTRSPITPDDEVKEREIVREQLKRNYEFFKDEGMKLISESIVVIIGVGSIGSHLLMTLARSGVKKLRIIDPGIVTPSMINRHAFAYICDIGQPIVNVCKNYISKINPGITVECVSEAFTPTKAEFIADATYVIESLENTDLKAEVIHLCLLQKTPLLCVFDCEGMSDPTCIRVTELRNIQGNEVAKRIKTSYKRKHTGTIGNSIKAMFSIEETSINVNRTVKATIAPVSAILGQGSASVVLTDLANCAIDFSSFDIFETIKNSTIETVKGLNEINGLIDKYEKYELRLFKIQKSDINLDFDDYFYVFEKNKGMSSVSKATGNKMQFVRWNPSKGCVKENLIIVTGSEANKHFKVKSRSDLVELYGQELVDTVDSLLSTFN